MKWLALGFALSVHSRPPRARRGGSEDHRGDALRPVADGGGGHDARDGRRAGERFPHRSRLGRRTHRHRGGEGRHARGIGVDYDPRLVKLASDNARGGGRRPGEVRRAGYLQDRPRARVGRDHVPAARIQPRAEAPPARAEAGDAHRVARLAHGRLAARRREDRAGARQKGRGEKGEHDLLLDRAGASGRALALARADPREAWPISSSSSARRTSTSRAARARAARNFRWSGPSSGRTTSRSASTWAGSACASREPSGAAASSGSCCVRATTAIAGGR